MESPLGALLTFSSSDDDDRRPSHFSAFFPAGGLLLRSLLKALPTPIGHSVATARLARPLLGDVDLELAAADVFAVQARDGAVGLFAGLHLDEAEAT